MDVLRFCHGSVSLTIDNRIFLEVKPAPVLSSCNISRFSQSQLSLSFSRAPGGAQGAGGGGRMRVEFRASKPDRPSIQRKKKWIPRRGVTGRRISFSISPYVRLAEFCPLLTGFHASAGCVNVNGSTHFGRGCHIRAFEKTIKGSSLDWGGGCGTAESARRESKRSGKVVWRRRARSGKEGRQGPTTTKVRLPPGVSRIICIIRAESFPSAR